MSQVDQAFLKAFSKGRLPLENSTASQVPGQAPQVLPSAPNKHVVAHSSHAAPSIHVSQTSIRKSSSSSVSNSRIDHAHLPESSHSSETNPKSIYFRAPQVTTAEKIAGQPTYVPPAYAAVCPVGSLSVITTAATRTSGSVAQSSEFDSLTFACYPQRSCYGLDADRSTKSGSCCSSSVSHSVTCIANRSPIDVWTCTIRTYCSAEASQTHFPRVEPSPCCGRASYPTQLFRTSKT